MEFLLVGVHQGAVGSDEHIPKDAADPSGCHDRLGNLSDPVRKMKNVIKTELDLLRQRLAEALFDLRQLPADPYRVALTLAVLALLVYAIYFAPVVPDLGYWVRYGSFPRR
jgi:hypothetical protein